MVSKTLRKLIVHVADIEISEESGAGRIAWHWKNAFEKQGYDFLHIGPKQVEAIFHRALFPYAAYRQYQRLKRLADVFLVHELSSGFFLNLNIPTAVFSHGLERRNWQLLLQGKCGGQKIHWYTHFSFPLLRLRQCDLGLRKATLLLLTNFEDANFVKEYYHRSQDCIWVFKNGVYPSELNEEIQPDNQLTILFIGSWLERKGIRTLIEAAKILYKQGLYLNWILAGTVVDSKTVLNCWPVELRSFVEVIPYFKQASEENLFARSNIFVLPSFFEGQPLALLQAMESGRCCITTDCCGQRDLIQHRYNGLLCEPGNTQQLAFLIKECVKDRAERMRLGKNAKLSVKNHSWEIVSTEVVDRIKDIIR